MNEQALILRDDAKLAIQFTGTAQQLKTAALEASALIATVVNAQQQEVAVAAQRDLATLASTVEKARKAAKEPVLAFGKSIDDSCKAFVKEIADEQMRIARLVGDFQQLEAARVQAAERARQLEAERIEREQREEQQRILRAEQERLAVIRRQEERLAKEQADREAAARREADEAARKIYEATNAKAREKAEAEAKEQKRLREIADAKAREEAERAAVELKRQQELAEANTHADLDAAQERASNAQAAIESTAPAIAAKAQGQAVIVAWDFEVVDLILLAKAHWNLVKVEPRRAEILALLKAGAKVSGIRAWQDTKSTVRPMREAKAIEA